MNSAEAIKHLDVYGKEQYWLKISKGEHSVMVNVGKKTYDNVKELDKVQSLPLDGPLQGNYPITVEEFNNPTNIKNESLSETTATLDDKKRKR